MSLTSHLCPWLAGNYLCRKELDLAGSNKLCWKKVVPYLIKWAPGPQALQLSPLASGAWGPPLRLAVCTGDITTCRGWLWLITFSPGHWTWFLWTPRTWHWGWWKSGYCSTGVLLGKQCAAGTGVSKTQGTPAPAGPMLSTNHKCSSFSFFIVVKYIHIIKLITVTIFNSTVQGHSVRSCSMHLQNFSSLSKLKFCLHYHSFFY